MKSLPLEPVKQIAAVLYRSEDDLEYALKLLSASFSPVDYRGASFPFVHSHYYEEEMGSGLQRLMISFERLVSPGCLAAAKHSAKKLEEQLARNGNRTVNLDIGYLDLFKLILASYKGRGNKIYVGDWIWADMILYFEKGDFQPFLWSFPDFKSGIYHNDLREIRSIYRRQLKEFRDS